MGVWWRSPPQLILVILQLDTKKSLHLVSYISAGVSVPIQLVFIITILYSHNRKYKQVVSLL